MNRLILPGTEADAPARADKHPTETLARRDCMPLSRWRTGMHARRAASAALCVAGLLAAAAAAAQTWEYRSYKKNAAGQYESDKFVPGTISVDEKDGQGTFRMIAGRVDVCYRGGLPAAVTRTAELTVIEVTQPVPGCEAFRYTIRNDGSGGFKETLVGERWVKSKFDHGLTPSK